MFCNIFVYIAGTLLDKMLAAPAQLQPCPAAKVPDPTPRPQSYKDAAPLPESCPPCNTFYTDFVVIPRAAAVELETRARGTTNALWVDSRQPSVTASNMKYVPKTEATLPDSAPL